MHAGIIAGGIGAAIGIGAGAYLGANRLPDSLGDDHTGFPLAEAVVGGTVGLASAGFFAAVSATAKSTVGKSASGVVAGATLGGIAAVFAAYELTRD